jgi:hypothetical protein
MLLDLLKVIAVAALAFVVWWAITRALTTVIDSAPAPVPAPTTSPPSTTGAAPGTAASPATAVAIAKLNDTIAKLTTAVDRLSQQLAERDRLAKSSGSSSSSSQLASETAHRQEIYARHIWRRPSWRGPMCSW